MPTVTIPCSDENYAINCGLDKRHLVEVQYRPPWENWYAEAKDRVRTSGALLVICGSRGSGKTQIGTELVRDALARGDKPAPRYARVMDFFLALRSSYGRDSADEREAIGRFIKPSLLVLDEVHERGGTEWEDRMLRYLIDKRYGDMTSTVLIGNLKREALMEAMGRSVASRVQECGEFIECVGVDWRARKS